MIANSSWRCPCIALGGFPSLSLVYEAAGEIRLAKALARFPL